MDLVGRTLGKYSVTGRLGSGGMGVVYRARHPGLEIDVALRVLSPATAANPAALARFRREATLLARLNHTGIVPGSSATCTPIRCRSGCRFCG